MSSQDSVRVGDAERDTVAAALREHYAQGRLSLDELNDRLDAAFAARTFGDLRPVTADLPAPYAPPGSAMTPRQSGTGGPWTTGGPWRSGGPWGPGSPWSRRSRPPFPFALILIGLWIAVLAGHGPGWLLLPLLFLFVFSRMRYLAWAHAGRRPTRYRGPTRG